MAEATVVVVVVAVVARCFRSLLLIARCLWFVFFPSHEL